LFAMSIEIFFQKYYRLIGTSLFAGVLILSFQLQEIDNARRQQLFFIPSPEYVERLSGTFRSAVAIGFFMQGVLELAKDTTNKIDIIVQLFKITIRLDPKLKKAAFLGGVVAPVTEVDMAKGIEFLKEVAQMHPDEWRIPYWIGFKYFEFEEFEKSAEYYKIASTLPEAPHFLKFAAIQPLAQARSLERAIFETESLLQSVDGEDAEWVKMRLEWLATMQMLEAKAKEFKARTGNFPNDLKELVEQGLIDKIPEDDFGYGFFLDMPGHPEEGYRVRNR